MKRQAKTIWFYFGIAVVMVSIGTFVSLNGGEAGGTATRRGNAMDMVHQIAYPVAVILLAGGLFYFLIRRLRR